MSLALHTPTTTAAAEAILLPEHHLELERACRELLEDTYADEPRTLGERWRAFEDQVTDHLAAEEELVIPAFAREQPEAAARLLRAHAHLRARMAELALEVDLHVVRAHTVEALIDELRFHAEREQEQLYPWAQRRLGPATLSAVRARVSRWMR